MEIFHQIKTDPLRAFLSLFGVSVGIFVVTLSFALVEAFSKAVASGFDHFGSDMIMVERFPVDSRGDGAAGGGAAERPDEGDSADWNRYAARPQASWQDFLAVAPLTDPSATLGMTEGTTPGMTAGAWRAFAGKADADIYFEGKTMRDVRLLGVGGAWQHLVYSSVCAGRSFSTAETSGSEPKAIVGAKIASELLGADPSDYSAACGKTIRSGGRNLTVTGVMSLEGKNIISLYATDYAIIVPFATAEAIAGSDALETMVAVGPGAMDRDAAVGEVRRLVRAARRLSPVQSDNFVVNTMEDLCRPTMSLTGKISTAGIVIALFSLLIGGFGIVNIMLVSVRERSWQIGLKLALGATRRRILLEFILEALLLSALGATLGLLLAAMVCALIPATLIKVAVSPSLALLSAGIALSLGLASGMAPALQASRLNPVDALRQ